MDNNEFMEYVREMKRQGLDDRQIATRLGIDISEFKQMCDDAFNGNKIKPRYEDAVLYEVPKKVETVKPVSGAGIKEEPKQEERKEKVDGIFYVPQNEDKFMNEPIIKKEKTEEETAM